MPEYGRNIQNMVAYCLTIEDRAERQQCAASIVRIMGQISPNKKPKELREKALWDHLAIISNFQLDIDYPYGCITKEAVCKRPNAVPYPEADMIYRHYGHLIQGLIQKASEIPAGPERDALALAIAKQMKINYINWNKNNVDDFFIFKDLFELSNGALVYNGELHALDVSPVRPLHKRLKKGNYRHRR